MATRKLGKYEVIERLGRGGMAEVYRAYHPSLDRFVAIKVLHPFLADDPEFKSRFEKEARNIARLKHPNIVGVYDFENDAVSESYYMVMELIEGMTLKDMLYQLSERGEHLPLREAIRIGREAASALAYAHNQGMIHRDVKPANLMFDRDNRVILTDFGIAKIVTGAQFTASGGMVGTPAYMAPEQGLGEQGDERSDLYSLGTILFQMVTGSLPYEAETPLAIILKHLNEPVPSARDRNPDIPEVVDRIIRRLLAKQPDERYQTAGALIMDLERIERALDRDPSGQHMDEHETIDLGIAKPSRTGELPAVQTTAEITSSAGSRGGGIGRWLPWMLLVIVFFGGGLLVAAQSPGGIGGFLGLVAPSETPTATAEPSITPTDAPPTQTIDPTVTATFTETSSQTPSPTATEASTLTPTPPLTHTETLVPTATSTLRPTETPTATLTYTPTPTFMDADMDAHGFPNAQPDSHADSVGDVHPLDHLHPFGDADADSGRDADADSSDTSLGISNRDRSRL
ncbi:MAG: protein kinase [Chloroflexi bacterium]|nr:protein kinase [Chloroflexota bacterium]